ncbi:hypothetical protein Q5762_22905 [Streptomyces sp. P9(2023)]|uniref:hypothetical protein n=1 Tax=Streptomyces sp. P9(2023) TaxID=3064394 RepID=UPI0028F43BF3|nr:hypothetical protein [Streptomyces sp. P9(2023)]MDT9691143.1 hypothetical protein [Streptomyces sp. P9(2023)]
MFDQVACVVGEFRGSVGPYAMLRPVGGGREWQADPRSLRPATPEERLSAGVRAANARARTRTADLSRPPAPVPGCEACAALDGQRRAARVAYDGSAETDANVLLRRHLWQDHDVTT